MWAGLERRSIQFRRADIGKYRHKIYVKLAISDVTGKKTKRILNEDTKVLPKWIKALKPIPKRKVARTKANDGGHLVSVFDAENHRGMIRLFLALKPWILDDGYSPLASRQAAKAWRKWKRTVRNRRSLKNLNVVVTGALSQGTRPKVLKWLRSLGAHPQSHVNEKTDFLIRGLHYLGDDRQKIKSAKKMKVEMMSEAQFYRRYLE
jgi:NAD-dependent DNA ligase